MQRKIRRVPLDFNHPLNVVWPGFQNTLYNPCPLEGTRCFNGQTGDGNWFEAICRLLSSIGREAARNTPEKRAAMDRRELGWPATRLEEEFPEAPRRTPSRATYARLQAIEPKSARHLAWRRHYDEHPEDRALQPLTPEILRVLEPLASGRDFSNIADHASTGLMLGILKVAGLDLDWVLCPVCKGSRTDPATRAAGDAWRETEPPSGDGWQLWETVSEGSPVSPVFPTERAFRKYLLTHFGDHEVVDRFMAAGETFSSMIINKATGEALTGLNVVLVEDGKQ
jgi:hypothetical protein